MVYNCTQSSAMESLLRNLNQHVTCSLCFDTYNQPKTIACLHTFCCQCLENHARASHRQGKFRCPECKMQIDLPEGNRFDSLPTSFFHNSLLSLLAVRQSRDGSSKTCDNCKERSSDAYCFDCARFMCPVCLNGHEVMTVFQGHKLKPLNEFQAQDYEALVKRQPFCTQQYHGRQFVRYFCLHCHSRVCHICIATDHGQHEVILLDEAADNEKANIMAQAVATRENEQALKEIIRKFDDTISKLETNIAIAKRGISQAAETMITKIREREREAIASVDTTHATRLEKINSAKENLSGITA